MKRQKYYWQDLSPKKNNLKKIWNSACLPSEAIWRAYSDNKCNALSAYGNISVILYTNDERFFGSTRECTKVVRDIKISIDFRTVSDFKAIKKLKDVVTLWYLENYM